MRAATTTPAAFDMRFVGALTPEALKAGLEDGDGLITFVCPGEEEFVRTAREAGEIMLHRDSDERGVTRVRLTPGRDPTRDIGLTTATLDLHSDRPATQRPPQVLLLWCRAAAGTGGESILVQADAAVAALAARDPAALAAACDPEAAIFRTGTDEFVGPIFDIADGRVRQVRLRFDRFVHVSIALARVLPALEAALRDAEVSFRLRRGEGYAVRNDLWLHGRRQYDGERELLRIMLARLH